MAVTLHKGIIFSLNGELVMASNSKSNTFEWDNLLQIQSEITKDLTFVKKVIKNLPIEKNVEYYRNQTELCRKNNWIASYSFCVKMLKHYERLLPTKN